MGDAICRSEWRKTLSRGAVCPHTRMLAAALVWQAWSVAPHPSLPVGIVITKPPESVCVVLPPPMPAPGRSQYRFLLFDSHGRPEQLGVEGGYLAEELDAAGLAVRLRRLFVPLPPDPGARGGDDGGAGAWMFDAFDAAVFQAELLPGGG